MNLANGKGAVQVFSRGHAQAHSDFFCSARSDLRGAKRAFAFFFPASLHRIPVPCELRIEYFERHPRCIQGTQLSLGALLSCH